jgi:hypothetical protein
MEEFLKLYGSGDSAAMAFGVFLAFLGLFTPKKILGMEFEWTVATSAVALILGILFFAFSYPQLRFWKSHTVNVEVEVLAKLKTQALAGIVAINNAKSQNSYPACYNAANVGIGPLQESIATLIKLVPSNT